MLAAIFAFNLDSIFFVHKKENARHGFCGGLTPARS